jgi:hypothetical protein
MIPTSIIAWLPKQHVQTFLDADVTITVDQPASNPRGNEEDEPVTREYA